MVSILLATYNGEKFIAEQLDSLISQSVENIRVFIRDDCSTDSTCEIIQQYIIEHPQIFSLTKRQTNSGSPWKNFMELAIAHANDDYVMLCDQDDVWLPNKVELTLKKMQMTEMSLTERKPILIFTDLKIVDSRLNIISESLQKSMDADFRRTSLNQLLMQNTTAGCTIMYNRALGQLLTYVPDFIVMHDWWLVQIASAFGVVDFVNESTILYRQHGENQIGATNVRSVSYLIDRLFRLKDMRKALTGAFAQAQSFYNIFGEQLSDSQHELLQAFVDIPSQSKVQRCLSLCRLGSFKKGILRKIATFIVV